MQRARAMQIIGRGLPAVALAMVLIAGGHAGVPTFGFDVITIVPRE